jgi:hypothetical protein
VQRLVLVHGKAIPLGGFEGRIADAFSEGCWELPVKISCEAKETMKTQVCGDFGGWSSSTFDR